MLETVPMLWPSIVRLVCYTTFFLVIRVGGAVENGKYLEHTILLRRSSCISIQHIKTQIHPR